MLLENVTLRRPENFGNKQKCGAFYLVAADVNFDTGSNAAAKTEVGFNDVLHKYLHSKTLNQIYA